MNKTSSTRLMVVLHRNNCLTVKTSN